MKLDRVKATLKPYRTIRSLREGRGDGNPVDVTELELAIDVGGEGDLGTSFDRALVDLFGATVTTQIKGVPSREAGFDLTSRSKVPDVAVSFWATPTSEAPIVPPSLSSVVRSRPKLKVSEKGTPVLELRRVVLRPLAEDVPKLHKYIGADFFISTEAAQVDASEIVEMVGEGPHTRVRPKQITLVDGGKADVESGESGASA